ncbi:superinfection immunity protein [Mucilaginibacter sp. CSA2-8R]|uniref:superinfection immunity protein n=1 Tax=Mucilaginibacter sp. CSA2-8R TaxID=3141542 RepID=UPI00315DEF3C
MIIIFFVIGLVVYFIPAFVGRNKRDRMGITLLNLFLGWSILGWIGALIWAVTSERKDAPMIYHNPFQPVATPASNTEQLMEYKKLLDAGAITQEEFDQQKLKLLAV